ncbi:ELMO domain-containing protein 1 [Hondaea fermentalgiana]|uniref:ELMO domain-containing protein 1 n=1 Tax=Hondaea fermentalgiana TaxID=2315210 RepID=A0A2R5GBV2_9STRA|nr:ELMO domain-containing protein 1 [Hondaea fermentalgiana]|eukprot:GBG25601.1 ELMO domain-containing protein 1 [Hondaea fermentalgiana]
MIVLYEVNSALDPVEGELAQGRREVAAFRYEGTDLTLKALRKSFPERGEFHFRAKVRIPGVASTAFAWQDLVRDDQEIPRSADGGPPHIRALPINFADDDQEPDFFQGQDVVEAGDTFDFYETAHARALETGAGHAGDDYDFLDSGSRQEALESSAPPPKPQEPSPAAPPPVTMHVSSSFDGGSNADASAPAADDEFDAFFAGASSSAQPSGSDPFSATFSFLKKSAQAAAMSWSGGKEGTPTTQQKGALENLARKLRETFDSENREHIDLLQTSWKSCFPKQRFQRAGPQWRLLGFAKEDPSRDRAFLSRNGMLGLYCLAYHLEHNRGVIDNARLPVAPSVGQINTHFADQFGLRSGAFLGAERPYWPLFDMGAGAYYELVSVTLRLAEAARPSVDDDGAALGRGLEQVFAILSQGPPNIGAFYEIARRNNVSYCSSFLKCKLVRARGACVSLMLRVLAWMTTALLWAATVDQIFAIPSQRPPNVDAFYEIARRNTVSYCSSFLKRRLVRARDACVSLSAARPCVDDDGAALGRDRGSGLCDSVAGTAQH